MLFFQSGRHAWSKNPWINRSKSAKNAKTHGFFEGRFRKYAVFSIGSTCMVKKPMDKVIEVCTKCKHTHGFFEGRFRNLPSKN